MSGASCVVCGAPVGGVGGGAGTVFTLGAFPAVAACEAHAHAVRTTAGLGVGLVRDAVRGLVRRHARQVRPARKALRVIVDLLEGDP